VQQCIEDTEDARLKPFIESLAREVSERYRGFVDCYLTDSGEAQPAGCAPTAQDLEWSAWEAVEDYTPENFRYLRSTMKRDMLNEAEHLLREAGWLHKDGKWSRKRVTREEAAWLFGGEVPVPEDALNEPPSTEVVEELRLDYPTLVQWAESGCSNEQAALALGVNKSTVSQRRARELSRLLEDTELVDRAGPRSPVPRRAEALQRSRVPGGPRVQHSDPAREDLPAPPTRRHHDLQLLDPGVPRCQVRRPGDAVRNPCRGDRQEGSLKARYPRRGTHREAPTRYVVRATIRATASRK
jgi:hypothetical protein